MQVNTGKLTKGLFSKRQNQRRGNKRNFRKSPDKQIQTIQQIDEKILSKEFLGGRHRYELSYQSPPRRKRSSN